MVNRWLAVNAPVFSPSAIFARSSAIVISLSPLIICARGNTVSASMFSIKVPNALPS
jgi:hypothetical protein